MTERRAWYRIKTLPGKKPAAQPSPLEADFESQLNLTGCTGFVREYKFHPTRRFRFDFAWPRLRVAAEVQGGVWTNGAHARPSGIERDAEKLNEATLLGWTVLFITGSMVWSGRGVEYVRYALEQKE